MSYVAIGTLGFAVLGFAASLYAVFKAPRPANRAACAYMTLSLLGVVGIGALMFAATPATTRPDHWMYGRYADGAVLPLLMLGLLTTGYRRWASLCILIPAAFVALVYITPGTSDLALSRSGLLAGPGTSSISCRSGPRPTGRDDIGRRDPVGAASSRHSPSCFLDGQPQPSFSAPLASVLTPS